MLTSVRWRIAIMFVALSSVLYLVLSLFGILAFSWSLDSSIDEQLRILVSEFGHAIELNGDKPHFRDWLRVVKTEPARSLASIQLFDSGGTLIEHYGPPGPAILYKTSNRIANFRLRISPLTLDSHLIGFLQISMPTGYRDEALQKLELTALFMAPFLLLGLGLTSYIVSDAATAPIRENLRMLKRFFADASHELNTPLSILQARSELLAKRISSWDKDTEDIQIIEETTERMSKIVSDLMLLAEIEGTSASSVDGISQLDQVLKGILAEYKSKCDDRNISIQLTPCLPQKVGLSQETLHRILSNLVENAWRYTDSGGKITVSTSHEDSFVKVVIEDTGIGIPADSLPLIFDRFYRVDKSRSRASGGLGLGLSIVKALVDSHQGHIYVRSKIGEGTAFTVSLPTAT
jgi:two-component system, OmpR family, manganese sensing sensor histidine kinase